MKEFRNVASTALVVLTAVLLCGLPADSFAVEESTAEQLKELQELRKEVDRRRSEMRRELRLLEQILGETDESSELRQYEQSIGLTSEELAAELRVLRVELEGIRTALEREMEGIRAFDVTGQVRNRFEWNDHDFNNGNGDVVQLLRSRVRIEGNPEPNTKVVVEVQDSRFWGDEAGTFDGSGDQVDFHQGYLHVDELYDKPIHIKVGRQELRYGSERLIGAVGWSNTGRSFDALKLRYGTTSYVEALGAKLAEKQVGGINRDRNFWGLSGHIQRRSQAFQPYVLLEHDKNSGADRLRRFTAGLRAAGEFTSATRQILGYEVEGAYQGGDRGTAEDIQAFMATARLIYKGPSWTRPRVEIGLDWLSGDADPTDTDSKAFDTLFATNHKFYGLMDLFVDIPRDTGGQGLVDVMLKGELWASEHVTVGLHVHHFSLAEGADKNLGQELDAIVTLRFNEAFTVNWGGLIFVPSDAMKASRGGEDPAFKTYLQSAVNF